MTASENTRERLAEVLRKCQMVPYDDGEGGWLYRHARPEEQADALLPLIDTLLREKAATVLNDAADAARSALCNEVGSGHTSTYSVRRWLRECARTFGGER